MLGEAMCAPLFHDQFRVPTYEGSYPDAQFSDVYSSELADRYAVVRDVYEISAAPSTGSTSHRSSSRTRVRR